MLSRRDNPIALTVPAPPGQEGFALLIVIWAVGLISVMALTLVATTHYRVKAAANVIEEAKAVSLAEAGLALATAALTNQVFVEKQTGEAESVPAGAFVFCAMPSGALAAITTDDEAGKIDLNAAPPALLEALLRGFGASDEEARALGWRIRTFSAASLGTGNQQAEDKPYHEAGLEFGPKHAPFDTTLELDQIPGMTPALFEAVLPYVTVHSHQTGVDTRVAAPALLAALTNQSPSTVQALARPPASLREVRSAQDAVMGGLRSGLSTPSTRSSFLIHAEVAMPGGALASREAILTWHGAPDGFVVEEWRQGRSRFSTLLKDAYKHQASSSSPIWPGC